MIRKCLLQQEKTLSHWYISADIRRSALLRDLLIHGNYDFSLSLSLFFSFFSFNTGATPKGPGSCSHLSEASMSEEETTVSVTCLCLVPELIRPLCFAPRGEVAPGGTGPDTSLLLFEEVTAVEGESSSFSECVTSNSSPAEIALSRHSSIWSHRMLLFSWMYGATCAKRVDYSVC